MAERRGPVNRIFTYEEAVELLPEVQRLTADAVEQIEVVSSDAPPAEYESIVSRWADAVMSMGI